MVSDGYSVVEAKCGNDALLKLRRRRPDLIPLDVNMSGIKGLDACREMRSGNEVPIIMLTEGNTEREKVMALDAGADDYLVKPFGVQE